MSEQKPFLTQKHYLVIFLVVLGAGLLGISPSLLGVNQAERIITPIILIEKEDNVIEDAGEDPVPTENIEDPVPTETEEPSFTYFVMPVMRGPDYFIQTGVPTYLSNFVHSDVGCNWMGVAGQVFGKDGTPVTDLSIIVSGEVDGQPISLSGMTGDALAYGPGGFEIQFADAPFASSRDLQIVVRDKNLATITLPIPLTTYADCSKNLILINFMPM
jgi:hypothetical protein